jgi:dihydroorotate dehydrogenase
MNLDRPFISPPFGRYVSHRQCNRVLGSFTWERRNGLIYHSLKTIRTVPGGYINKVGLRNRGIRDVTVDFDKVYSLVGLEHGDWESMWQVCPPGVTVELNLGCPNVHEYGIESAVLRQYCEKFQVIAKLPPTDKADDIAAMCIEMGVVKLHCSNTVPTWRGGISGAPLFRINLPIVERLAARYPDKIIAGGGIYYPEQVKQYAGAGAWQFSLSSIFFTPWKVPRVLDAIAKHQRS